MYVNALHWRYSRGEQASLKYNSCVLFPKCFVRSPIHNQRRRHYSVCYVCIHICVVRTPERYSPIAVVYLLRLVNQDAATTVVAEYASANEVVRFLKVSGLYR